MSRPPSWLLGPFGSSRQLGTTTAGSSRLVLGRGPGRLRDCEGARVRETRETGGTGETERQRRPSGNGRLPASTTMTWPRRATTSVIYPLSRATLPLLSSSLPGSKQLRLTLVDALPRVLISRSSTLPSTLLATLPSTLPSTLPRPTLPSGAAPSSHKLRCITDLCEIPANEGRRHRSRITAAACSDVWPRSASHDVGLV